MAVETSGTRWLSVEEQETWRAFIGTCYAFFTAIDAQLQRDTGIPLAYYEILVRSRGTGPHPAHEPARRGRRVEQSRISHARGPPGGARLDHAAGTARPTGAASCAELTDEGYAVLVAAAPATSSRSAGPCSTR